MYYDEAFSCTYSINSDMTWVYDISNKKKDRIPFSRGAFHNFVDKDLPNFDSLPPSSGQLRT